MTTILPGTRVETVHDDDVLLGRGAGVNRHGGNVTFRMLVRELASEYSAASLVGPGKDSIARQVVHEIKEKGGRFLRRSGADSHHGASARNLDWCLAEEELVISKVKQAFRDFFAKTAKKECSPENQPEVMRHTAHHSSNETQQVNMPVASNMIAPVGRAALLKKSHVSTSRAAVQKKQKKNLPQNSTSLLTRLKPGFGPIPLVGPNQQDDNQKRQAQQILDSYVKGNVPQLARLFPFASSKEDSTLSKRKSMETAATTTTTTTPTPATTPAAKRVRPSFFPYNNSAHNREALLADIRAEIRETEKSYAAAMTEVAAKVAVAQAINDRAKRLQAILASMKDSTPNVAV